MFMFRMFVQLLYSGSGSITAYPRDRRGGGHGSFVSFSEQKETKDRATSFSSASSAYPFPLFPPTLPSPSCSPPGIRFHPYLSSRVEEEARAPPPPSMNGHTASLSSASSPPSFPSPPPFSSFLSYSPAIPPNAFAQMCVLLRCLTG